MAFRSIGLAAGFSTALRRYGFGVFRTGLGHGVSDSKTAAFGLS